MALRLAPLSLVALGVVAAYTLRPAPEPSPVPVAPAPASIGAGRLVELGSTTCKSCRAMHAELAALRAECEGDLSVEEVDVYADAETAGAYGVQLIPTQVFLDAAGQEFDRHTGFLPRQEIRRRFATRGLDCAP